MTTTSTQPKKPRAEYVYIDAKAFPKLEAEEPGVITIGPEPADVGQQPWPTYPTLWDIHGQYLREWVIPPDHLRAASNMDLSVLRVAA